MDRKEDAIKSIRNTDGKRQAGYIVFLPFLRGSRMLKEELRAERSEARFDRTMLGDWVCRFDLGVKA